MPLRAPDPYAVVEYNGRPMLNCDKAMVMKLEHVLGYRLTITQAIGDAPASAGYHAKGRMLDLPEWDAMRKLKAAKDNGCIGWARDERDDMVPHEHLGVIFESRSNKSGISEGGYRQISQYDRGENGLTNGGRDRNPYRADPKVVFTRDEYEFVITGGLDLPPENAVTRERDHLVEVLHELSQAIQEGKTVADERPVVGRITEDLKRYRREIRERLEQMPKR
jgi:hypothetical protein